jgi:hypothetical protein
MTRPMAIRCPRCSENDLVPVVYGLPGGDLLAAAERGEFILGGCEITLPLPSFGCRGCDTEWVRVRGRLIPAAEARRIEVTDRNDSRLVTNRSSLLALNECESLQRLADRCVDFCLDGTLTITPLSKPFGPGVHLQYTVGWYSEWIYDHDLCYPFTIDHFWTVIDDLGDVSRFDMELSGLKDTIEAVEGFAVELVVDEYGHASARHTTIGRWVGDIDAYPYSTPMQDRAKVGTWKSRRFEPHYPGIAVEVVESGIVNGLPFDDESTLGEVRGR